MAGKRVLDLISEEKRKMSAKRSWPQEGMAALCGFELALSCHSTLSAMCKAGSVKWGPTDKALASACWDSFLSGVSSARNRSSERRSALHELFLAAVRSKSSEMLEFCLEKGFVPGSVDGDCANVSEASLRVDSMSGNLSWVSFFTMQEWTEKCAELIERGVVGKTGAKGRPAAGPFGGKGRARVADQAFDQLWAQAHPLMSAAQHGAKGKSFKALLKEPFSVSLEGEDDSFLAQLADAFLWRSDSEGLGLFLRAKGRVGPFFKDDGQGMQRLVEAFEGSAWETKETFLEAGRMLSMLREASLKEGLKIDFTPVLAGILKDASTSVFSNHFGRWIDSKGEGGGLGAAEKRSFEFDLGMIGAFSRFLGKGGEGAYAELGPSQDGLREAVSWFSGTLLENDPKELAGVQGLVERIMKELSSGLDGEPKARARRGRSI